MTVGKLSSVHSYDGDYGTPSSSPTVLNCLGGPSKMSYVGGGVFIEDVRSGGHFRTFSPTTDACAPTLLGTG